jgi:hypothetical protein
MLASRRCRLFANLSPTTSNCLSKLRKNVWITRRLDARRSLGRHAGPLRKFEPAGQHLRVRELLRRFRAPSGDGRKHSTRINRPLPASLLRRGVEDAVDLDDIVVEQALDLDHRARRIWRLAPEFRLRLIHHGRETVQVPEGRRSTIGYARW